MWVNPAAITPWARLFDIGTGQTAYMFLTLSAGGGPPRFAITTNGGPAEQRVDGVAPPPVNQWTHFAVTLAGTTATLYINGVAVGSNSGVTLTPDSLGATTRNWIGRSSGSRRSWCSTLSG